MPNFSKNIYPRVRRNFLLFKLSNSILLYLGGGVLSGAQPIRRAYIIEPHSLCKRQVCVESGYDIFQGINALQGTPIIIFHFRSIPMRKNP